MNNEGSMQRMWQEYTEEIIILTREHSNPTSPAKASVGQKPQWDKGLSGTNAPVGQSPHGTYFQVGQMSSGTNVLWDKCLWDNCQWE